MNKVSGKYGYCQALKKEGIEAECPLCHEKQFHAYEGSNNWWKAKDNGYFISFCLKCGSKAGEFEIHTRSPLEILALRHKKPWYKIW